MLYIRTLVSMLISFFTSRLVLKYLGVEDYGLYNVVGGTVLIFSSLSATLSGVTQRYITFAIGLNDDFYLKKVFTASIKIHLILSLIILVLLETVGLWYVNHILNVPSGRIGVANFIFQTSLLMFIIDIATLPFNSAVIAYEKFSFHAIVSIIQSIVKMALVIFLLKLSSDALMIFAVIDLFVVFMSKGAFVRYVHTRLPKCRYINFKDPKLYKEIMNFSFWNFFGTASSVIYSHGGNLMINKFFGVALNAAIGLTNQVQSAITSFVSNFSMAVNPQITKSYAAGDFKRTNELVFFGSKISSLLLLFICAPIVLNLDYLLGKWLFEVPEYTYVFICASLLASFFSTFNSSFNCLMFATGDIKIYQITCVSINISSLLALFFLYRIGIHPSIMFFLIIFQSIIKQVIMLVLANKRTLFPIKTYLSNVFFRGLLLLCAVVILFIAKKQYSCLMTFPLFLLESIVCLLIIGSLAYFLGLNAAEKQVLRSYFKKRI